MNAKTLRTTDAPAEWHIVDTRGIVAVLMTETDLIGWIATSETGTGVVAAPRLGERRWFRSLDEAQPWLESFLPDTRFALTDKGRAMLETSEARPAVNVA